jgi:hypothetical protein
MKQKKKKVPKSSRFKKVSKNSKKKGSTLLVSFKMFLKDQEYANNKIKKKDFQATQSKK